MDSEERQKRIKAIEKKIEKINKNISFLKSIHTPIDPEFIKRNIEKFRAEAAEENKKIVAILRSA